MPFEVNRKSDSDLFAASLMNKRLFSLEPAKIARLLRKINREKDTQFKFFSKIHLLARAK
ncbi:MAG: hypothetical protein IPL32_12260 [Chloracidobacterium sp.]|nr:hypothetical protein [Chloracidobacterium sp.]